MQNFDLPKSPESEDRWIVVEVEGLDGGIVGYEVMPWAEAKRQNDDPNVQKLPDKMPGVLHGSDTEREVFWREISGDEGLMSREQAADYAKTRGRSGAMSWDEYLAKWHKDRKMLTKGETEIRGKKYFWEHKPEGILSSYSGFCFIRDNWEIPRRGKVTQSLEEELEKREQETIRDEKGEIVAICSYLVFKEGEGTPRDVYGDGLVSLTVVKEEYRQSGIGYFATKRAVDRIIECANKRSDFVPPVIVKADAHTEGGWKLMQKISKDYGRDVFISVGSEQLLF